MQGRPRTSTFERTIAVSLGDPGGIGPEVLVRALGAGIAARWPGVRFVVHGSSAAMSLACEQAGIEPFWWRVERGSAAAQSAGVHEVLLIDADGAVGGDAGDVVFEHRATRLGGMLSFQWVDDAIASTRLDRADPMFADAMVTGPISKHAWHLAGPLAGRGRFPGHTEMLQSRYHAKRVVMMFRAPKFCVSLATAHVPLMDVRDVMTIGRVYDAIDLGAEGCRRLGIAEPRIAVCGLNPHAGEAGLMGDEESRLIEPAIQVAVEQGLRVRGPFPGDTIFGRALAGEFDLVVAMYHDQGLIPVKLLDRDASVNITMGLPTVRTSPDHGTAFDIAGKGRAEAGSMIAAIDTAVRMVGIRAAGGATGGGGDGD